MTVTSPDPSPTHNSNPQPLIAPPGLKGLVVADTEVGEVRGLEGYYHYRGRSAPELAENYPFESVVATVLSGAPPQGGAGSDLAALLGRYRHDAAQRFTGEKLPAATEPLLGLRAVAAGFDGRAGIDLDPGQRTEVLLRIAAAAPVVIGRYRDPNVEPDPDASHVADTVRLLTGSVAEPDRLEAVGRYLSLTIDHGFNASTFTARVVASTGSDLGGVMGAAMAALSGPLHGGAPSRVLDMLGEIGEPANTESWVRQRLEAGDKIMGFGHAVYRAGDPRTELLRRSAMAMGGPLVERAVEVEQRTLAVLRAWKPDAVIVTNVEFYAAVVLHLAGIPQDHFTAMFTISRMFGWAAHVSEQLADNKIMRPSSRYVGQLLSR